MSPRDDIQAQNIPVNINWEDPNAIRQVVDVARQQVIRANALEERIKDLEEIVFGEQN